MDAVIKDYVAPVIPLAAAALVYFLGKAAYFRQKEYELLTKRYLDEGIDAISKNVDKSLAQFRQNWWHATVLLKHFRDLGKDIRPELYQNSFLKPDSSLFEIWRDYRLKDIVGSDIFNRAHQSLDAFVKTSYAFFQDDLSTMVRVTLEGGKELEVKTPRDEMVQGYLQEVEKLDKEAEKYYVLLGALQNLSSLIESERFSFQSIKCFRLRHDVQRMLETLEDLFPEESGSHEPADHQK